MTLDWNDAVDLLSLASVYDQRTVGEEDVKGWLLVANRERWTTAAAQAAIVEHYSRGADRGRVTPPVISDRIRALRIRATETFELPRIPDGLANADYPAWLRRQRDAHCDALLERWASTGEEPPLSLPPPPVVVNTRRELEAATPPAHKPVIGPGLRKLYDRETQPDPERRVRTAERRERARAELDAIRDLAEGAS